jgi:two-component system CheB/CheR fusion protein
LKELADRLLAAFWQQTPDYACLLLDPNGIIVGWCGAAESVFGYTQADVLGESIDIIFTEGDIAIGIPTLERTIAAGNGRAEDDRWHVRKDKARIWVSGAMVAIRDHDKVLGFAKVVRDRTDLKTQVESLNRRSDGLEGSLKGQEALFARIAHELRNSITPLSNSIELLTKLANLPEATFALTIAKRQAALLDRMVTDLAEVARVKSGKLLLVKQQVEVVAELQTIANSIRDRARHKHQDLVLLAPPPPLVIWADRQRFHQIIFNLLDNAIKYTGDHGHIWLKCIAEDDALLIKVQDDGFGIAPELLPLIFNLFAQEAPELSAGGMGVGLALVKELVEAHRGFMEVRSDGRGKGSEFSVRLPNPGTPT